MKRTSETNHIKILNGAVETLGIVDVANVKKKSKNLLQLMMNYYVNL